MILAGLIVMGVLAACGEYALWRCLTASGRLFRWRKGYVAVSVLVWVAFWGLAVVMWCGWADAAVLRVLGYAMVLWLFNCMAKVLLAVCWVIGRRTGHVRAGVAIGGVLAAGLAVVMGLGMTTGLTRFRVERVTVASERLPEVFDGYRVAFFSDVHTGLLAGGDRQLERLVAQLNAVQADLVICGGDLVNNDYRELDSAAVAILSRIEARDGVMGVLGNHDLGIYMRDTVSVSREENIRRIVAAEQAMGWRVLRDSTCCIVRGADTLAVTGLEYPEQLCGRSHERVDETYDPSATYGDMPSAWYNITVSHAPQTWDALRALGRGDLTLSGHVHSMQMKLRVGRWRWSPAAWLYDRWSGRYDEQGQVLYINDGIGCALLPMRIGARPEITVLELKRK